MSSKKDPDEPDKDPYKILNLPFGASKSDVTKAYRKLALKYHPDKQNQQSKNNTSSTTSQQQQQQQQVEEIIGEKFQEIQAARDFLLNDEKRRKYDSKRASFFARKAADEAREMKMSSHRKRMRQELVEREAKARRVVIDKVQKEDKVDKLRQEGIQMHKKYAEQQEQKQQQANDDARAAAAAAARSKFSPSSKPILDKDIENRQIRLKWSRKRMTISPSEHSLAELMKVFGLVEDVELLGSKGNAALITFRDEKSCRPCVEAYMESNEMRASFVGSRKEMEERKMEQEQQQKDHQHQQQNKEISERDIESVQEYQLRHAAQREELLRQMEQDEFEENEVRQNNKNDKNNNENKKPYKNNITGSNGNNVKSTTNLPFPPEFPSTDKFQQCATPYDKLQLMEDEILQHLVKS